MNDVPPLPGRDTFTREHMQKIAAMVDEQLPQGWAFMVIAQPFDAASGRCNYISNGRREDCLKILKGLLARWENPKGFEGHFDGPPI